jgi:integrase
VKYEQKKKPKTKRKNVRTGQKTKPQGPAEPLSPKQVEMLNELLSADQSFLGIRDYALFRVMVDTMLRVSDVVALKVRDVLSEQTLEIKNTFSLQQKKTSKLVHCMLSERTRDALREYLRSLGFRGSSAKLFAIGPRQVQLRIKAWAKMLRIDSEHISPHSLRRTKPAEVYRKTGNLRAAQIMLGHSNISTTALYLGIERKEAMDVFSEIEM